MGFKAVKGQKLHFYELPYKCFFHEVGNKLHVALFYDLYPRLGLGYSS